MSWTLEQVNDKLGDKAQATARGIIVLTRDSTGRAKHILIGEFTGDTFNLTPEGVAYLEADVEDAVVVSTRKTKGTKKALEAPVEVTPDDGAPAVPEDNAQGDTAHED